MGQYLDANKESCAETRRYVITIQTLLNDYHCSRSVVDDGFRVIEIIPAPSDRSISKNNEIVQYLLSWAVIAVFSSMHTASIISIQFVNLSTSVISPMYLPNCI